MTIILSSHLTWVIRKDNLFMWKIKILSSEWDLNDVWQINPWLPSEEQAE